MLSNDVGCSPRFSAWVIGEIASLQPGQIPATATAAWATVFSPSAWPCKSTSITNQTGNSAVSPATPRPMQCQEFRFGWICKLLQNHCRNSHNWGSIARHIFRLSSALVTQSWALDTVLQDFSNCSWGGGLRRKAEEQVMTSLGSQRRKQQSNKRNFLETALRGNSGQLVTS